MDSTSTRFSGQGMPCAESSGSEGDVRMADASSSSFFVGFLRKLRNIGGDGGGDGEDSEDGGGG